MHTYIHTDIHTYTHTYICTYTFTYTTINIYTYTYADVTDNYYSYWRTVALLLSSSCYSRWCCSTRPKCWTDLLSCTAKQFKRRDSGNVMSHVKCAKPHPLPRVRLKPGLFGSWNLYYKEEIMLWIPNIYTKASCQMNPIGVPWGGWGRQLHNLNNLNPGGAGGPGARIPPDPLPRI